MSAYSTIRVHEAAPGVVQVTLNRPEAANALSTTMGRDLLDLWSRLSADAWAGESARMGLPEAGLGIIPGLGGTQLLTRAVGERRASEMLMSGLPVDAAEALSIGLVNAVRPNETLVADLVARAVLIASKAPLSIRAVKAVVRTGAVLPLAEAMDLELSEYNRLFTTEDRREGVAAFNQKRPAVFRGV